MPDTTQIKDALASSYGTIRDLIPTRRDFTDEDLTYTTAILDGGSDMYDFANILNTNRTHIYNNVKNNAVNSTGSPIRRTTSILYTHTKHTNTSFVYKGTTTVTDGTSYFGTGSTYFTNLYPGFFVLVANNIDISEFSISGNIGTDGGGVVEVDTYQITVNSNLYTVFRKNVGGTSDPSINHIIIIPGDGTGVTRQYDTSRSFDDHGVFGLNGLTDLYFILVARASGARLAQSDSQNIVQAFLELVETGPSEPEEDQTIEATSISSQESISSNEIKLTIETTSVESEETLSSNEINQNIEVNSIESENDISLDTEVKNSINITSIESEENLSDDNRVAFLIRSESVDSEEGLGTHQISQNIKNVFVESIDPSLQISTDSEFIQNLVSTSLTSTESVTSVEVKLTIQPDPITLNNLFGDFQLKQGIEISEIDSIESDEDIPPPLITRNFYVSGYSFCQENPETLNCKPPIKGNKISNLNGRSGYLPAVTSLNQKLYVRDTTPITRRPRKGFYIEWKDYKKI